ncbi:MAG: hypothetical protein R3B09_32395, partial [Nannocystaceae bacterium]
HNARFKSLAEELGLRCERHERLGWTTTRITPETADEYATTLADLEAARSACAVFRRQSGITVAVPGLDEEEGEGEVEGEGEGEADGEAEPKTGGRSKLACKCDKPRSIRVSPTIAALGSISCGLCGEEFAPC